MQTIEPQAIVAKQFVALPDEVYIFDYAEIKQFVLIDDDIIIPPGCVIESFSHVRKKDVLTEWTIYQGNPLKKISDNKRKKTVSKEELSFLESIYIEKLVKRRMEQ